MQIDKKIDDLYAWQILSPLMVGYPYLPFTGASARPMLIAQALNDILVNRRRSIIEFGSGISTILIARLIQRNGLDAKLVSIEHDPGWADAMTRLLVAEGIDAHVDVVCAPLTPCELALEGNGWYDVAILGERMSGRTFDMAIVDGPPAWASGKAMARYPAAPFLKDRMAERYSFFLDDCDREGERAIIAKWNEATPWEFKVVHKTFAIATAGDAYYTTPFRYGE